MLVAVLSDIHANRHALEAVLEDIARTGPAETWCLGDLVGYGGDPDACTALALEHCDVVLAGNHDLAVTGELSLEEFSLGAALAARWTQETMEPAAVDRLAALRPSGLRAGIGLYHASPRDPVWEYVVSALMAELCIDVLPGRIGLIGHSHVALSFTRPEGAIATGERRGAGVSAQLDAGSWLINPGSVGQPRDGDPRAAWLLLDTEALTAVWMRSVYDVAGAQAAIRAARLPDSLAERLQYGQ